VSEGQGGQNPQAPGGLDRALSTRSHPQVLSAGVPVLREFRCELCGAVFEAAWSDADAIAEYEQRFGSFERDDPDLAVVCEDCFQKLGLPELVGTP
jgi:hypothetical protein